MKFTGFLFLVFLFTSCNKELSDEFVSNNIPVADTVWRTVLGSTSADLSITIPVDTAFTDKPAELDSFDAALGDTLLFDNDLQLFIPPYLCTGVGAGQGGGAVATGKIFIKLIQLTKRGDIVKYNRSTIDDEHKILEFARCFSIVFMQNNVELGVVTGRAIGIGFKDSLPKSTMKVYYGNTLAFNTVSNFNWRFSNDSSKLITTPNIILPQVQDSGYLLSTHYAKWFGAMQRVDTSVGTNRLNVLLPINFTNANTAVYAIFKNKRVASRLTPDAINKLYFINNMPSNTPVKIITLSKVGADYFYSATDVTAQLGTIVTATPAIATKAAIIGWLNDL